MDSLEVSIKEVWGFKKICEDIELMKYKSKV